MARITKQGKTQSVEKIKKDFQAHSVVAVASIASLPSRQYNLIKKKTRGKAKIDFARHTLLIRALEEAKPEAKELEQYLCNGAVLVFSDLNAFKLFNLFKQNKSKTAAKPGAIAPNDITVPAGETNLAPGPVLTELKQAKIDAKIQGQKIVISKDAVVAKKGAPISEPVAKILSKLGIEPMEIGMQVIAVYDNGVLYKGDVLDIDTGAVFANLVAGVQHAINLSVSAEIYNAQSTPYIISKAAREAIALNKAIEAKKPVASTAAPATEPQAAATDAAAPAAEPTQATQ